MSISIMRRDQAALVKPILYFLLLSTIKTSIALGVISPGVSIKDGSNTVTVVSAGQSFELGFFSPSAGSSTSTRRYLGIWYKSFSTGTVVWVANRETPLLDRSGLLQMTEQGILVLLNGENQTIWSSTANKAAPATARRSPPVARLLDSGNLVVMKDQSDSYPVPENYLWQSFDYPTHTFLPGMKIGINLVTGFEWSISSWKSSDDPARGDYTFGIDPRGFPQLVVKRKSIRQFRLGPWNGIRFTGAPRQLPNPVYTYGFVLNKKETYYHVERKNDSVPSRFVIDESGLAERLIWMEKTNNWAVYYAVGEDQCDKYVTCGAYARCNINDATLCTCLKGFQPKSSRDWDLLDWSSGCVREIPLTCDKGEGFVRHKKMKLPDTSSSWYNFSMSLTECQQLCLKNCSCSAYTSADIKDGGSGCLLWFGELTDMREYPDTGQDLYVRMAASYLDDVTRQRKSKKRKQIAIIVCSVVLMMGIFVLGWILYRRMRKHKSREKMRNILEKYYNKQSSEEELELPLIDFSTIVKATENFSIKNKLGKGGFGPVYKGTLGDGQEIAVKRLSINSGQGLEEFINEVILIVKLQHRNLVKLLGCCIEGDERMLVYEYMPNKSLDYFIFNESKSRILDLKMRINIIDGIARGLLYLHQDSRLRIIHRDLKTSNILLDHDMNPKISDFGMARIFGGNQTEANTNKVVGTYGYIAPEYAAHGLYSVKSDIFSFGVLVLEIVSGTKNRGFWSHEHQHNLLGHAWRLWMESRPQELIDNSFGESDALAHQILRYIHIGLLCVQHRPEDRPTTSSVVLMLGSEILLPDQPKQPGFYWESSPSAETDQSSSGASKSHTKNEMTMTILQPR